MKRAADEVSTSCKKSKTQADDHHAAQPTLENAEELGTLDTMLSELRTAEMERKGISSQPEEITKIRNDLRTLWLVTKHNKWALLDKKCDPYGTSHTFRRHILYFVLQEVKRVKDGEVTPKQRKHLHDAARLSTPSNPPGFIPVIIPPRGADDRFTDFIKTLYKDFLKLRSVPFESQRAASRTFLSIGIKGRTDGEALPSVEDLIAQPLPPQPDACGFRMTGTSNATNRVMGGELGSRAYQAPQPYRSVFDSCYKESIGESIQAAPTPTDKNQTVEEAPKVAPKVAVKKKKKAEGAHVGQSVGAWRVQDVMIWLSETCELPQYAEAFKSASIDGPMLQSLSAEDLEHELGIASSLHRRKILMRTASLA